MKPIKLNDFLSKTAQREKLPTLDLNDLGLFHAAPRENETPVLSMHFDPLKKALVPS